MLGIANTEADILEGKVKPEQIPDLLQQGHKEKSSRL